MKRILLIFASLWLSANLFAGEPVKIKVGSYNLFTSDSRIAHKKRSANAKMSDQRYWCNSAVAAAAMVNALECDVLGLQEVCDSIWGEVGDKGIRDLVKAQGGNYEWILYPNTKSGKISYDVAIAYNPDVIEVLKSGIFFMGGIPDRPEAAEDAPKGTARPCVWADMRHKASGEEFYFLSAHFLVPKVTKEGSDYSGCKYNCQQCREIAYQLIPEDMPSILVGDFNLAHGGPCWGSIANGLWVDTFEYMKDAGALSDDAKRFGTQNNKDESGFSKWYPDHIMFNGFKPLNYVIDRRKFPTADGTLHFPSDHLPITSELVFRDKEDHGPRTEAPAKKSQRFMSFNIRYFNNNVDKNNGWDQRKHALPAMINDVRPVVAGLQECSRRQEEYIVARSHGYKSVNFALRTGEAALKPLSYVDPVIYDSTKVQVVDYGGFWLSETPDEFSQSWNSKEPRCALWVKFKFLAGGKEFIFINTHLDHVSVEARKNGVDVILARLAQINKGKLPMILVGDMNAQLQNEDSLERLEKEWQYTLKTAADSDPKYTFNGFGRSWTGTIDYIWTKGVKKCSKYRVVARKYCDAAFISDHYPIYADLEM